MRNGPPLDGHTDFKCHRIMSEAHRAGRDAVEELHRHRMILSPARELEIRRQMMDALLERLGDIRPADMLRRSKRTGNTPTGMYETVVEFIQEYRDALREES